MGKTTTAQAESLVANEARFGILEMTPLECVKLYVSRNRLVVRKSIEVLEYGFWRS
jgi:hypothetical protein